jgi:hypothetical protein
MRKAEQMTVIHTLIIFLLPADHAARCLPWDESSRGIGDQHSGHRFNLFGSILSGVIEKLRTIFTLRHKY